MPQLAGTAVSHNLETVDWTQKLNELDHNGWTHLAGILDDRQCEELSALYAQDQGFRSRVVMARHSFGQGEYKYFSYPLPDMIAELRRVLYTRLVPLANRWNRVTGRDSAFPDDHQSFIAGCHNAGQTRPTPLLLKYGEGDYNCLHQDLYGEHVFPVQGVLLLSDPENDFTGGEFIFTTQRPRLQSVAEVIPLRKGDMGLFAVHQRPVQGRRGPYRVTHRHGVSKLRSGKRYTAGIIFHDAA